MEKKLVLLEYLIDTSEFKSSNELSKILRVSTKTISRYIKDINELIIPYGYEVLSRQGMGYGFSISKSERDSLKLLLKEKIKSSGEFTEDFILVFDSIISNESDTIVSWARKLYISESNLRKELDKIKDYLSIYKLNLREDDNGKRYISGDSDNRVQAILNYIHNLPELESASHLVKVTKRDKESVKHILVDYFTSEKLIVSDLDINFLVDLIIVCINEIRLGRFDDEVRKNTSDYIVLIESIERQLKVNFSDNYKGIIVEWIKRCSDLEKNDEFRDLKGDVINILSSFDSKIIARFINNQELIDQLVVHMNKFIKRGQKGIEIENPIVDDIKKGFPAEFSIAYYLCKELGGKYNAKLTEAEIGFIAVYLAAQREINVINKKDVVIICHYGMGTANLLKERVVKHFPQFKVQGVYSYSMRKKAYELKVDLVISSVELDDCPYEYIYVKDIFGDDFNKNIGNISFDTDDRKDLINLVSPSSFYIVKALTSEQTVFEIGEKLKKNQFLDEKVISEIIEREKISSTDIGNLVAIPHTFTRLESESFISVCKLDNPIKWGTEFVQLIFFIVFNYQDKNNMGIFRVLYNFIEDKRNVDSLLENFNYLNFVRLLDNLCDGGKL